MLMQKKTDFLCSCFQHFFNLCSHDWCCLSVCGVEWSATSASCTNSQRLLLLLSAAKLHHTKSFVLSLLSFFDQKQFAGMLSKFEVRAKSRIKWVWIKIVESRLRSLGPGFPPTTVEKCAAMCSVLCCSVLCCSVLCSVCRLCITMFSVKFVLCSVL